MLLHTHVLHRKVTDQWFGPKSRNGSLLKRLSDVLDAEVQPHDSLSEYFCQSCYREFLKVEKVLLQSKQIEAFRGKHKTSIEEQLTKGVQGGEGRQKRCNRNSPASVERQKRPKPLGPANESKKNCIPSARRILLPKTDDFASNSHETIEGVTRIEEGPILDTCKTEVRNILVVELSQEPLVMGSWLGVVFFKIFLLLGKRNGIF